MLHKTQLTFKNNHSIKIDILIEHLDLNRYDLKSSDLSNQLLLLKLNIDLSTLSLIGFNEQRFEVIYLNKENSVLKKSNSIIEIDSDGLIQRLDSKYILVIPKQLEIKTVEIESLYIFFNNETLQWPNKLDKKFTFKIPQEHKGNYKLEVLSQLNIKQVSFHDFIKSTEEIPLFIGVYDKLYPNNKEIENKFSSETFNYAVMPKSHLSGFLFGLDILENEPNNSTSREIYSTRETLI